MSYNFNKEGERMLNLAKELYPHNRSLMGPDIRYSMQKFVNLNRDFKEIKFFTGEKVFDWEIPEEWIIRDAYIEHESGKRFAEFKKCNLSLNVVSTAFLQWLGHVHEIILGQIRFAWLN